MEVKASLPVYITFIRYFHIQSSFSSYYPGPSFFPIPLQQSKPLIHIIPTGRLRDSPKMKFGVPPKAIHFLSPSASSFSFSSVYFSYPKHRGRQMTKSKQKSILARKLLDRKLLARKLLDLSYLTTRTSTSTSTFTATATATRTLTATTAQLLDLSYLNLNRSRRITFERTIIVPVTRTFIASTAQSNRVSNMNSKEKEKFENLTKISKIIKKRLEISTEASNICEANNKNKPIHFLSPYMISNCVRSIVSKEKEKFKNLIKISKISNYLAILIQKNTKNHISKQRHPFNFTFISSEDHRDNHHDDHRDDHCFCYC